MKEGQVPCVSERYKDNGYTAPWKYKKKNTVAEQSLFSVIYIIFFQHTKSFSAYFIAANIKSEQKFKTALDALMTAYVMFASQSSKVAADHFLFFACERH